MILHSRGRGGGLEGYFQVAIDYFPRAETEALTGQTSRTCAIFTLIGSFVARVSFPQRPKLSCSQKRNALLYH